MREKLSETTLLAMGSPFVESSRNLKTWVEKLHVYPGKQSATELAEGSAKTMLSLFSIRKGRLLLRRLIQRKSQTESATFEELTNRFLGAMLRKVQ